MAQQGQHQRHLAGGRPQPIEGRPGGGREGPPARAADISLLLLALHPDVALASLPPGRAVRVVTELALRVHGARPLRRVYWIRQSEHASVDPPVQATPPTTVAGGGTDARRNARNPGKYAIPRCSPEQPGSALAESPPRHRTEPTVGVHSSAARSRRVFGTILAPWTENYRARRRWTGPL